MELTKATELALSLMDKHDLSSWGFYMDNAKRRFGCCHYNTRSISLSKELVQANSEDRVKMTILHEIAHALVGHGNGHNRIWKNKCLEIGGDGNRCYTTDNTNTIKGKWQYNCINCGRIVHRHRKIRKQLACGRCCKKYNNNKWSLDYLLVPYNFNCKKIT